MFVHNLTPSMGRGDYNPSYSDPIDRNNGSWNYCSKYQERGYSGISVAALAILSGVHNVDPQWLLETPSGSVPPSAAPVFDYRMQCSLNIDSVTPSSGLIGDQKPLLAHFYPGDLRLILTKVSVLTLSARLRTAQKRIEEMEEEDEEAFLNIEIADMLAPSRHKHELSIWKNFGRSLRLGTIRELAIISVQRLIEIAAISVSSLKTGKALVKNVRNSALRKYDRYTMQGYSTMYFASKMFVCTVKAQSCFWFALFVVNQSIDSWFTYKIAKSSNFTQVRQDSYFRRLVLNACICTTGCVLAGAGASIGSVLKPGLGTILGVSIAPQFAYIVF